MQCVLVSFEKIMLLHRVYCIIRSPYFFSHSTHSKEKREDCNEDKMFEAIKLLREKSWVI